MGKGPTVRVLHTSGVYLGKGGSFLLVLSQAVKGTFVFISLSIQKGKSICVQEEEGKGMNVYRALLRRSHCAQCLVHVTSFREPSKLSPEFAVCVSSPFSHPRLASFHHQPLR